MSQKALNFSGHSLSASGTNRTGLTVGAVLPTYNSILGQLNVGDTFTYLLRAANTNGTAYGWETGQATYTAANTVTLVPTDSTNGGAALNLPNGPHQLLCTANATSIALGPNVLTVGSGGQFSTIQAALDYIATQPAFTLVATNAFQVSSWAEGSSQMTVSAIPANLDIEGNYWFQVAGDVNYYQMGGSSGSTTMLSSMNRIGASIAAATNVNTYTQNLYTILLLQDMTENVTLNANMHARFQGASWFGSISNAGGFASGSIRFREIELAQRGSFMGNSSYSPSTPGSGWSFQNTVSFSLESGVTINSLANDFFSPSCFIGAVKSRGTRFKQSPHVPLGHLCNFSTVGDVLLEDSIWEINVQSSITPDARFVDFPTSRKLVIAGLHAILRDPLGVLSNLYVVASCQQASGIDISDVTISCDDATPANIQIFETGGSPVPSFTKINVEKVSVAAPNGTGTKKLIDTTTAPTAGNIVLVKSNGVNLVSDVNTAITYSIKENNTVQSVAFAASLGVNSNCGNVINVGALTAAMTVNAPTNPQVGQKLTLNYTQNATGGYAVTYNAVFKASAIGSGTANQKLTHSFVYDGANWVQQGGAPVWL